MTDCRLSQIESTLKEILKRLDYNNKNNKLQYRPQNNCFMNIKQILTCLLRLGKTEEELKQIKNYKKFLCEELQTLNFYGKLNFERVDNFLNQNECPQITTEQQEIINNILLLREERQKEYKEKQLPDYQKLLTGKSVFEK
jgi:hypothetical protein